MPGGQHLRRLFLVLVILSLLVAGCTPKPEVPVDEDPAPVVELPVEPAPEDPAPVVALPIEPAPEDLPSYFAELMAEREDLASIPFSFTYLTRDGRLMKANFTEGSEELLIEKVGGPHFSFSDGDYEVHPTKPLIAYLRGDEVFLYNYQSNKTEILYKGFVLCWAKWSPLGGYLLIDDGTDIRRANVIYNVSDGSLLKIGITGTAYWSPDERYLAIGAAQPVSPPLLAHDGYSTSTVLVPMSSPEDRIMVAQGSQSVFCSPMGWLHDGALVVEFRGVTDYKQEFYVYDLSGEALTPYAATPQDVKTNLFRYVSYTQPLSPDGKYRLYQESDKIMLWVSDTDEHIAVAEGLSPKWWP
jgi:hypothetical protein